MAPNNAHHRLVGVGVGPANLSLSCLAHGAKGIPAVFFDREPVFGWHDSQLIPGSTLQVSMLKDLVTLADPTNEFSFLSYLHAHGRIYHFINARFEAVPREEFRDYMAWAARRNDSVVMGENVREVDFDGSVFHVRTDNRAVTADNISVGVGTSPWLPPHAKRTRTQFHVAEFTGNALSLADKRVCVIGGGQSGAEAYLDLLRRPPGSEQPRRVLWVSRRANYFPIDDSPFTNDYYMPCHAEHFFGMDRAAREAFNQRHILTSDGITESTLRDIYRAIYVHQFQRGAKDCFALYPNRDAAQVTGSDETGWKVRLDHLGMPGTSETIEADVIIWATGFRSAPTDFLSPIEHRFEREGQEFRVDADFAVEWDGPADRGVFIQNGVRAQRGLADANLSLLAWRSQRILDRIRGVRSDDQLSSFIEWAAKPDAVPLERA